MIQQRTFCMLVLLFAFACDNEEASPAEISSAATTEIGRLLASYEQVRATLVADQADVSTSARTIAEAATTAKDHAPALASHLDAIAREANVLAELPSSDIEELREKFGDVSRHVVAMMIAEPTLARGYHVFDCPMAQDYGRWVQRSSEIENPYMGQRMLQCGAETAFEGS